MNKYFKTAAAVILLFHCFTLQAYGEDKATMIQAAANQISLQERELLSNKTLCKDETIKQDFLNQDTFFIPLYDYDSYWKKFSEGGAPQDIINSYQYVPHKTYAAINSEGEFIQLIVPADDSAPKSGNVRNQMGNWGSCKQS